MEDRRQVYVRLFAGHVSKRAKFDFEMRRVRVYGTLVHIGDDLSDGGDLLLDDGTGLCAVRVEKDFLLEMISSLNLGASLEVLGEIREADNVVLADQLCDMSEEPAAELRNMLETMVAYRHYFEALGPVAKLADDAVDPLSPIQKRPKLDPSALSDILSSNPAGITLQSLSASSGMDGSALYRVLQHMIGDGMCYENHGKYFSL